MTNKIFKSLKKGKPSVTHPTSVTL